MEKAIIIIQARTSSNRLPGKVLRPLLGKPMLKWVIERCKQTKRFDVAVATSTDESDDQIELLCHEEGVQCVRGSLNDVLDRYYLAASKLQKHVIIRITADCPFVDHSIIEQVYNTLINTQADYVSNTIIRTFPRGADVEAFTFMALEMANRDARHPYEREHVTPYIRRHPHVFKQINLEAPARLNHPDIRLTVDTDSDFALIQALYTELNSGMSSLEDAISLLELKPWLKYINSDIKPKYISFDSDPHIRTIDEMISAVELLLETNMFQSAEHLFSITIKLHRANEFNGLDIELTRRFELVQNILNKQGSN